MHDHGSTSWSQALLIWPLLLFLGAAYLVLAARSRRRGRPWPRTRFVWLGLAFAVLSLACSPRAVHLAHEDFRWHVAQHLAVGMLAPLGVALARPTTLLMRSLNVHRARRVARFLHTPVLRAAASPVGALLLNVGGMYVLYLTPLYALTLRAPTLHALVELHVLAAGVLYASVLAGVEPLVSRASFPLRVAVLIVGAAGHAMLGKLLYAGLWPRGTADAPETLRSAAQLMYYGGDVAEVLLAVLVFHEWVRRRRATRRQAEARPAVGTARSG